MRHQHNGTPTYLSNGRQLLDEVFPNRWIGYNVPVVWPDMTPLIFLLWRAMKALEDETPVNSEGDFAAQIVAALAI